MNAVMKQEPAPVAERAEVTSILAVISRAASDPACDIEKMERLLLMHERMASKQAQADFAAALSDMQDDMPSIAERGDAAGRYTYALWEDINNAIKPVLKRHGFALSFRTDCSDGIAITGVLSHRCGHSEQTTIKLPADGSGNKNAVQAVASSVSYGKRYTAGALLNLTSHGEDDDGIASGKPAPMTDEHQATVQSMCDEISPTILKTVLKSYKAATLSDIPDCEYAGIVKRLELNRKGAK